MIAKPYFGAVIGCAEDRDGKKEDNCTGWDNAGASAGPLGVVFEREEMNVRLSPRKAVRDHGTWSGGTSIRQSEGVFALFAYPISRGFLGGLIG